MRLCLLQNDSCNCCLTEKILFPSTFDFKLTEAILHSHSDENGYPAAQGHTVKNQDWPVSLYGLGANFNVALHNPRLLNRDECKGGAAVILCYLPLDSSSLLLLLESYILELQRTGDKTNLTALLH